jgi:EAL domain-containing protein (putative c-di-GMP-specific phosphodiesterase class I)
MNNNVQLIEMVERQRFGVEYQPIIDATSGAVFGYEALARFFDQSGANISPLDVFCALHDSPLMLAQVELQLKRLQLRFRPDGSPLFINLDPHAFSMLKDTSGGNELLNRLQNESSLVVELIENTDVNDAQMSNEVSNLFHQAGISIALDDLGAPGTMVALNILNDVDYIKFDRYWFNPQSESMRPLLKSLIGFAQDNGKKTVLEGVENAEDLAKAVNLGVDYVQGYFYRELFIQEK